MEDYLQLRDKAILVTGIANRKSVAYHIAGQLRQLGARVLYSVRSRERREQLSSRLPAEDIFVCDVGEEDQIEALAAQVAARVPRLDGLVHSIAFADYAELPTAFHHVSKRDFLKAIDVSVYSLIALARAFEPQFAPDASVVAVSISTTKMAAENYGIMGPVKATLDSSLVFLNKSFSHHSHVRFNAVGPGLLKTSASAGIPGYVDSYLYAEQVIPRRSAVRTEEAAATAVFLLSPRSSGIVGQTLVVDAGMAFNYFDRQIVAKVVGHDDSP